MITSQSDQLVVLNDELRENSSWGSLSDARGFDEKRHRELRALAQAVGGENVETTFVDQELTGAVNSSDPEYHAGRLQVVVFTKTRLVVSVDEAPLEDAAESEVRVLRLSDVESYSVAGTARAFADELAWEHERIRVTVRHRNLDNPLVLGYTRHSGGCADGYGVSKYQERMNRILGSLAEAFGALS